MMQDQYHQCTEWKQRGECQRHPEFMYNKCSQSCGTNNMSKKQIKELVDATNKNQCRRPINFISGDKPTIIKGQRESSMCQAQNNCFLGYNHYMLKPSLQKCQNCPINLVSDQCRNFYKFN